jgi:dihydroflavonol-4-reductase
MLGRHVVAAAIAAGHEAISTRRKGRTVKGFPCALREAELDDPASLGAALQGVDAAINCAGYYPTRPRPWRKDVERGTSQMANFYAACAEKKLRRTVYLGGSIALPRRADGAPGDETLEYLGRPPGTNAYLQVKWALDAQARAQAKAGLPVCIGIPAMTFGEYDPGNTTGKLILETARGSLPGYVPGNRNVIYAGDAGRGLVRVCEAGRVGERYLLTGENLSMDQLMGKIAAITGAPMPKKRPLALAKAVGSLQAFNYRWLRGPLPRIDDTAIAVMSGGQFLDGGKAKRELGFTAQVSVDEAIRRALGWYRAQGLLEQERRRA